MAHIAETEHASRFYLWVHRSRRWHAVLRELAYVASGVVLYFGIRGLTVAHTDVAVRHAHDIVSFERGLDVYIEPSMQDLVGDAHWLTTLMNWVYIWGHWPVIGLTLLWLVLEHPGGYRVTRNAMLTSGAVGLVVFALFPVAPPRLADLGLIDTVTTYSSAYRLLQPQAFVNQYAAMPSLHVGWDLLIGIALFTYGQHRALRIIGVVLPVLMAVSVLATANHYLADVVVGIALVVVSREVAGKAQRRRDQRSVRTGGSASTPAPPHPSTVPAPRSRPTVPSPR
jgi:hypothetical protein